jgi:hypothetical protein
LGTNQNFLGGDQKLLVIGSMAILDEMILTFFKELTNFFPVD